MLYLTFLPQISKTCFRSLQCGSYKIKVVVLCIPPRSVGGMLSYFRCRVFAHWNPKERGAESLSVSAPPLGCLSAVPTRSCLQQAISSVTVSDLPAVPMLGCLPLPTANRMLLLDQFLGFHSYSGSRLEGICVCVCVCVCCYLLFSCLLCYCFCCCCSIYTFQTCHAGPPLPPTAVRPPYKETVRAYKKQTMYREISKCIQRNVLLQRQYRGPPGAHYCSWWDKAGRELLSWLPGDGERRKGKKKEKKAYKKCSLVIF